MVDKKRSFAAPPEPGDSVDAELEQLMGEIQSLQQGLGEVAQSALRPKVAPPAAPPQVPPKLTPAPQMAPLAPNLDLDDVYDDEKDPLPVEDPIHEFRGGGDDAPMEESLGHLEVDLDHSGGALGEGDSPEQERLADTKVDPQTLELAPAAQNEGSKDEGAMSITLSGQMKLKLQYDVDGQTVVVGFQDGMLRVQLSDGAEFKIPIGRTASRRLNRVA